MTQYRKERIAVDPIAFGEHLRSAREAKQWSQYDLSYEMTRIWRERRHSTENISLTWVKAAERGEFKSVDRLRITCAAEALGVPVTRLLPPQSTPEAEPRPKTPADVVVALRGYGMSDADIEKLLPIIQQFHAGNAAVRQWIETHLSNPPASSEED